MILDELVKMAHSYSLELIDPKISNVTGLGKCDFGVTASGVSLLFWNYEKNIKAFLFDAKDYLSLIQKELKS